MIPLPWSAKNDQGRLQPSKDRCKASTATERLDENDTLHHVARRKSAGIIQTY